MESADWTKSNAPQFWLLKTDEKLHQCHVMAFQRKFGLIRPIMPAI
jgi:hypothetical protein